MDASSAESDSVCASVARPTAFGRRVARLAARWLPVLGLLLASGCETAGPAVNPVPVAPPSPQTQLEHVRKRLKDALAHAHAAANSSVVSERQCAVRLIEPTAPDEPYTAEVVIQTMLGLKTGKDKKTIKPIGEVVGGAAEDAKDAKEEAKADNEDEDPTFEKRYFKLVYKNQRWELAEPPLEEMTDTEKICIQSALSDG
jgi:hypothetical protein